jgi:hypothetical protein
LIHAQAAETAKNNSLFYNHEKGNISNANAGGDQDADMGTEIDFNFQYRWNPNLTLGGFAGMHMVGDYFAFDGTATPVETKNSVILGMNLGLQF